MRRANGDLLALEQDEEVLIPIWSSKDTAVRYKTLNPQLNIFWPVELKKEMMKRVAGGPGDKERTGFILFAESSPTAELDSGRRVALDDLFANGVQTHKSAAAHS